MRSTILRKLILAQVFAVCSLVQAQRIEFLAIPDIPPATDRSADLKRTSDNVNKHYTHRLAKGIDGRQLQQRYMELARHATTPEQYGDILLRYFAELRNSHTSVLFKRY